MVRVILAFMLMLWCGMGVVQAAPFYRRIVSLNLCSDRILPLLVAPERIAALSVLAKDASLNPWSGMAQQFPQARFEVEDIMRFSPDLVIVGSFADARKLAFLQGRGIAVYTMVDVNSLSDIRPMLMGMAGILAETEQAEKRLQPVDALLARPALAPHGSAVMLGQNLYRSDSTLAAELFSRLGYSIWQQGSGFVALENLVAHPPELLITAAQETAPSMAAQKLAHPALAQIPSRKVQLDSALLVCGDLAAVPAFEALHKGISP